MSRLTVPPYLAHAIAERRATQHRRPIDTRQPRLVRRTHIGGSHVHLSKAWTPTIGMKLPVHRSTDNALRCHTELAGYYSQRHGDITPTELAASDAPTLAEYARRWLAIHDRDWTWNATEPNRHPDDTLTTCTRHLTDPQALDRFHQRWADKHVWVLQLEVIATPDRFLSPAGRQRGTDEHGHTGSEPESIGAGSRVDPDHLHPHWANAAAYRHEDARPTRRRAA